MKFKIIAAVLAAAISVSAVSVTAFADRRGVEVSEKNFPDEVFRGFPRLCFRKR